jgi:predicted dehydrogenase
MDKNINWGILGAAEIANSSMIPAMLNIPDITLYAIASRSMDRAMLFQTRFGFKKAMNNYQDLLDDPNVEAVYIPLPNSLHKEWVLKAAASGKHILCEKPMAASEKDVIEMFNTCDKYGVILQEGFAYLHSPLLKSIKNNVESGVIGTPGMIEAVFFTPGYPDDNITVMRETNGGSLFDIGCYNISLMNYILGTEPYEVRAVSHFSKLGTDDFTSAWLNFGECTGVMMTGICSPQRADRFFIHGSKGSIEVLLPFNSAGRLSYRINVNNDCKIIEVRAKNNYQLEAENMNNCIRTGANPVLGRKFSIRQAKIMDQVFDQTGYWRL